MCDCYYHKCMCCKNHISIHIADFCVPRTDIEVICPDCISHYADNNTQEAVITGTIQRLFFVRIDCKQQVDGTLKDGRYKGKLVLIFSRNKKAYGICLN